MHIKYWVVLVRRPPKLIWEALPDQWPSKAAAERFGGKLKDRWAAVPVMTANAASAGG
jgi:hypothetical protein